VGTAKRERQKANRQVRLEQLAKQARVNKGKRTATRVGVVLGIVVVVVGLIYLLGGDDESVTDATTTTAAAADTTTAVEPIETPEVVIPEGDVTELKVTTLEEGEGPTAVAGDTLRVFYVGVLSADGTQFDANYGGTTTFDLPLGGGQVIQGWDQGLVGTQAGGRYQIDIPAELAYGDQDRGTIPANSDLTFVVDVVEIIPAGG